MESRQKILFVGDYNTPTGFAQVSHNILKRIDKTKYDVTVLACNYSGFKPVFPAEFPVYGCNSAYAMNEIRKVVEEVKPNILWTLNDSYVMPIYLERLKDLLPNMFWISYIVFDGIPVGRWADSLKYIDQVVFPTPWQQREVNKVMAIDSKVIWHGVDTEVFYPMPEKFIYELKYKMFGENHLSDFCFGMVAKNFQRKRYPELIHGYKLFLDQVTELKKDESYVERYRKQFSRNPLLLLYDTTPLGGEFDLMNIAHNLEVPLGSIAKLEPPKGKESLTDIEMNELYNVFDVNCLISIGEGYGLPTNVAAACGKPTIAAMNSVQLDIAERNKAMQLVSNLPTPQIFTRDNEQLRYLPDPNSIASAMLGFYLRDEDAMRRDFEAALEFANGLTWDSTIPQWEEVLDGFKYINKNIQTI